MLASRAILMDPAALSPSQMISSVPLPSFRQSTSFAGLLEKPPSLSFAFLTASRSFFCLLRRRALSRTLLPIAFAAFAFFRAESQLVTCSLTTSDTQESTSGLLSASLVCPWKSHWSSRSTSMTAIIPSVMSSTFGVMPSFSSFFVMRLDFLIHSLTPRVMPLRKPSTCLPTQCTPFAYPSMSAPLFVVQRSATLTSQS